MGQVSQPIYKSFQYQLTIDTPPSPLCSCLDTNVWLQLFRQHKMEPKNLLAIETEQKNVIRDVARRLRQIGDDIDSEFTGQRLSSIIILVVDSQLTYVLFEDFKQKFEFLWSFLSI